MGQHQGQPKNQPKARHHRVALQGFTAFEQQSLGSYFRLASRPDFALDLVPALADSDFCVVDADRAPAVDAVRAAGRMEWAVCVGAQLPRGAVMHLKRPIDPAQVVRALETLAAAHPSASAAAAPTASPARRGAAADAHFDIDVLVVGAADAARRDLQAQLEALGCRVSAVAGAADATMQLAKQRFRLVFSDVDLPGADGLSLCRQIKLRRKGAPNVVLLSAQTGESEQVRATLAGADGFLGRPFRPEQLVAVLRACSNRRRRAR